MRSYTQFVAGMVLAAACFVMADTAVWEGSVSSDFADSNNWNPPIDLSDSTGDYLTIGTGNPYNPVHSSTLPTRPNSLNTTVQAIFTIDGGDLLPYGDNTLNGQVSINQGNLNLRGNVYIGSGATGTVTVNGGSFSYKYTLYIGRNSGGNGTLNVWGGNVWMSGQPVVGSNGGIGHISIKNDRFIYCPGDQQTFFQGLITSGKLTTDPGWAILIDYADSTDTTSVTSTLIVPATEPYPSDWDCDIPVSQLKWRPGTLATSCRVYMGTDEAAVAAATTSTTEIYLGSATGNSMAVPYQLVDGMTYYWRVDTVTATEVRPGSVWRFTPSDVRAPRFMENLGRGVVAMNKGGGNVYIGWRMLGTDPLSIAFNLYRNGIKLNGTLITDSTNWLDSGVDTAIANTYTVKPVLDGIEQEAGGSYTLAANAPTADYDSVRVPLNPVPDAIGVYFVYHVFAGDLDGDGEYDLVVARESDTLATYKTLEAYKLDGTFLWRMNLGPNVQQTYTLVFDFDCDGKAEVLTKTSESTVFGDGTTIGDTDGDGITDYRVIGRQYEIWDGPEFLSMVDGKTGQELARTDFIPRGDINDWGDNYAHRANFIEECVAYLDGVHPSIFFMRGPCDYMKMGTWDFANGQLRQRWTWFNNHHLGLPADQNYADFHQIRAVDLDGDGKDELNLGGSAMDDDGTPLYGTELTHGDRYQIADFDPDRPGLEVFAIQQYNPTLLGAAYYAAATGEMIAKYYGDGPDPWDVGRGDSGDYDADHKGLEFFSTMTGMYDCKGQMLYEEHPFPTLGIWWDADLRREFFVGVGSTGRSPALEKWNPAGRTNDLFLPRLYNDGGSYNIICPWAGRPPFLGDILGDWREEVILETVDHSQLRIYTTTDLTTHRIYTLMQNPYYRVDVTHKGYTVTTYTDYYLGEDMDTPPPPYIRLVNGPAPKTGKILRQWWTGISGSAVSDLTSNADYPDHPDGAQFIGSFESPADWADSYGNRIRGYLYPPQTGNYTFWIAGDDTAELWLSSDALPKNAVLIASVPARTDPHQWDKYTQQQSTVISLTEGHKYYIEALQKEDAGGDHVAVAWQRSSTDNPQVIEGWYLSPWTFQKMGDLTDNDQVNFEDVKVLSGNWLKIDRNLDLRIDINGDCSADLIDLSLLVDNWLSGIY